MAIFTSKIIMKMFFALGVVLAVVYCYIHALRNGYFCTRPVVQRRLEDVAAILLLLLVIYNIGLLLSILL